MKLTVLSTFQSSDTVKPVPSVSEVISWLHCCIVVISGGNLLILEVNEKYDLIKRAILWRTAGTLANNMMGFQADVRMGIR